MVRTAIIRTHNWNPIIQMSDGVKNKFVRTDGKEFNKGKNIYYFQENFYDILSGLRLYIHGKNNRDLVLSQTRTSNYRFYFINHHYNKEDRIYRVLQVINVRLGYDVKPVLMVEDIMDTPEELYIRDYYERNYEDILEYDIR